MRNASKASATERRLLAPRAARRLLAAMAGASLPLVCLRSRGAHLANFRELEQSLAAAALQKLGRELVVAEQAGEELREERGG